MVKKLQSKIYSQSQDSTSTPHTEDLDVEKKIPASFHFDQIKIHQHERGSFNLNETLKNQGFCTISIQKTYPH